MHVLKGKHMFCKIPLFGVKRFYAVFSAMFIMTVISFSLTACKEKTQPVSSEDISSHAMSENVSSEEQKSENFVVTDVPSQKNGSDVGSAEESAAISYGTSSAASNAPTSAEDELYDEEDKMRRLNTFELGKVRITGGMLKETFDYWSDFYLNVPNENILYEFRYRTGVPQIPGERLGGWSIQLVGYEINEWISGFCHIYAITGNEAYKRKALYLLDEWYKCFEKKSNGLMWYNSHYTVKRWVDAFLDCYKYLDDEDAPDKLNAMYRWARNNLTFDKKFGDNGTEWYTLSEAFYRAYEATGEQKYFDYAERWEYKEYWDLFKDINNINPFKKPETGMNTYSYHVISHINSLNGAAMAYRLKGDEYYLTVMKNVYLWLKNDQMYSMGSIGAGLEWALPINELLVDLNNNHAHAETGATPCYTRYAINLMSLSGNAEIGDWIEKLHYNDVCAKIKPKQNGIDSIFMSYHDFNLNGGTKTHGWRDKKDLAWTSAAATLPIEIAELHKTLYYHEGNNLYLSTYAPSTLKWNRNGNNINVSQKTGYPQTGTIEVALSLSKSEIFSVKLRIPEWARGKASISVNGKTAPVKVDSSNWAVLRRNWKNGDKIKLELPMQLWSDRFSNTEYSGIMYGPLAMAVKAPDMSALSVVDPESLGQFTKSGSGLQFTHSSNSKVLLKPYYTYIAEEPYYFYIKDKK